MSWTAADRSFLLAEPATMSSFRRSSGGSSRSPSPIPSAASSSSFSRSGTTLSKESLYAPLTTYLPKKQAAATGTSDKNDGDGRKSPVAGSGIRFQSIPRELREAALLDHLSTISSAYHHPTMSASLAADNRERTTAMAAGMGRNNGGQSLPRRSYEDRLLQRSLVLVGGGLMTSSAVGSSGIIDGDGTETSVSRHVVDVSRAQRRKRRRDRGHRVRGSISNSERKRREVVREEKAEKSSGAAGTSTKSGGDDTPNNSKKRKRGNAIYADDTLLKLNDMWNAYICKLLGLEHNPDDGTTPRLPAEESSNRKRRSTAELSALLSSAELIGAFVRIDRCDASRAYVGREGIVVDSTANAWRIALPKPMVEKKAKRGKEKEAGAGDEEETTDGAPNKSNEEEDATTVSVVWKETVVPKSRSSLSFAIDTGGDTSDVPGKDLRVVIGQM